MSLIQILNPMDAKEKKPPKFEFLIKACTLTAVILVSYFTGVGIGQFLNLPNHYVSGLWCAATAIVVFDDLPDNARNLLKDRILGTLMGTIVSATCIALVEELITSIIISLLIVCSCITLFKWSGTLKIACITVLIVGVTTHGYPEKDIVFFAVIRFFECLIGGTLSFLATVVIDRFKNK
jgi:uncharacterized membrane protein YgaE (UPF0421/DUF939 family)